MTRPGIEVTSSVLAAGVLSTRPLIDLKHHHHLSAKQHKETLCASHRKLNTQQQQKSMLIKTGLLGFRGLPSQQAGQIGEKFHKSERQSLISSRFRWFE